MGSMEPEGGRLFFKSETFAAQRLDRRKGSTAVVTEPAQTVPVHTECDVLVVGGGPAGTAAAVAAARLGADVVLLERYNHLGRTVDRRAGHLDRPHDRLDRRSR